MLDRIKQKYNAERDEADRIPWYVMLLVAAIERLENEMEIMKQKQQPQPDPTWMGGTVVLVKNTDGTFSVLDNGEETIYQSYREAFVAAGDMLNGKN